MAGKEAEQREIYYSGRVQGVGFRYTARALAARHRVSGFVKNLPDGRVHLVVEGPVNDVQPFIDELQAEMGTYIQDTQIMVRPATGRLEVFEIRF